MLNNSTARINSHIKPFSFQLPQSEEFNEVLLENVDLDQLASTGDIAASAPFLRNFVQSKITSDTIRNMNFKQFDKMLRISQIAMDFYTQNQESKEVIIEEKMKVLQQKQQQLQQLQEIERQHQEKQQKVQSELDRLKQEAKKVKELQVKSIIFKCHHCDKCFEGKEFVLKHIEKNHTEQNKDDITNPEYLGSMLQQIQLQQQSQAQVHQSFAQTQQSGKGFGQFGNTIRSVGDPQMLGSAGFDQLKQQQIEKMEQKRKRKLDREQRRESDRQDRLFRMKQQEEQMRQFQHNVNSLLDSKMSELVNIQQKLQHSQGAQTAQQRKLLQEVEELKNMRMMYKEQSAIQDDKDQSKSKDEEILIDYMQEREDGLSQQSLNSHQNSQDQKLLINKNQQLADTSGMVSFHNYSYAGVSQNVIQIKQSNDIKAQQTQGQKLQSEMPHIGEMESDNEQLDMDVDVSYVRAVNKKSQVEHASEDYLNALFKKENKTQQEENNEYEEDLDIQQEIKKRKQNILGDDLEGSDTKQLQQGLTKLQMRYKETS